MLAIIFSLDLTKDLCDSSTIVNIYICNKHRPWRSFKRSQGEKYIEFTYEPYFPQKVWLKGERGGGVLIRKPG